MFLAAITVRGNVVYKEMSMRNRKHRWIDFFQLLLRGWVSFGWLFEQAEYTLSSSATKVHGHYFTMLIQSHKDNKQPQALKDDQEPNSIVRGNKSLYKHVSTKRRSRLETIIVARTTGRGHISKPTDLAPNSKQPLPRNNRPIDRPTCWSYYAFISYQNKTKRYLLVPFLGFSVAADVSFRSGI